MYVFDKLFVTDNIIYLILSPDIINKLWCIEILQKHFIYRNILLHIEKKKEETFTV